MVHDCGDPVFSDETFVMQLPETETDIEECVLRVEVRDALTALVTHHRGGARCGCKMAHLVHEMRGYKRHAHSYHSQTYLSHTPLPSPTYLLHP